MGAVEHDANAGALRIDRGQPVGQFGYGSVVSVTATFGQCAAGWVLDRLASHAQSSLKTTL